MNSIITIPKKIKRVAVTGATGFLGREVVDLLLGHGLEVVCTGRRLGGEAYLPNYHIIDFSKKDFSGKFLKNCDAVINCAGSVHNNSNSKLKTNTPFGVNTDAAVRLAKLATEHKVKKLIQISTVSIYGECFPAKSEIDEPAPNNLYGESNLEAETRLLKFCETSSLDLAVLRLTTLYGDRDPGNIGKLIKFLIKPYAFTLGDGHNKKSLIHVTDAARAVVASLSPPVIKTDNMVFNISDAPVEVGQIYKIIRQTIGRNTPPKVPFVFINFCKKILSSIGPRVGIIQKTLKVTEKITQDDLIDGHKFWEAYNFKSHKSLEAGLSEEVKYILESNSEDGKLKRTFDVFAAIIALALFLIPITCLYILIKVTSKGPAVYWSDRIGKNNKIFKMAKFRSMRIETPELATHLLNDPEQWVTPIGKVMRKTSLDELPQLWHILEGKMSFVGPRPALYNQNDLIAIRTSLHVDRLTPGVTGLAQISGRDELSIFEKVIFDRDYYNKKSLPFDIQIILKTFLKVFTGNGVIQANKLHDHRKLNNLYEIHPSNNINIYASSSSLLAATLAREKLNAAGHEVGIISIRNFDSVTHHNFKSSDFILCPEDQKNLIANQINKNLIYLPILKDSSSLGASNQKHADYIIEYLKEFLDA